MFNVWHGYISLVFFKNLKLNRLINIEYQHKSKSVTKSYALFINMDELWIKNMLYRSEICIIFYLTCLNYEMIPRLLTYQNKIFHTHIAAHIRTLACHTRSSKYGFYLLHDPLLWTDSFLISKLLPSQSIFMHLEYKNDHTCLPLPLLYFSIIWNSQTKTKYFHFRNFDWLTKITDIVDGCVYLKRPKRLFDISILVLSL